MKTKKKKRHLLVAEKLNDRRKALRKKREKENEKNAIFNKWPNGRMIYEAMTSEGIKGDVRDYMVLGPGSMIDYRNSYNVVYTDVDGGAGIFKPGNDYYIIHKKRLWKVIGRENASKFWHQTYGRLVDVKAKS